MAAHPENLRYVRVQDDLHGMDVDFDGNLVLACSPDATRNTMHFAINGVVGDHAYGRFNLHPDGSLKGKIVVIANPDEMGVPSGFNQVDTWFRMGASRNGDGTLARTLNAGHATVVVPEGVQVPQGMNAVFYDGTLPGRDAAVSKTLVEQGVVQRGIGFRSWTDSNEGDAPGWAREAANRIYSEQAGYIHVGMHDSSPDGYMDSVGIKNWVENFQRAGTTTFVDDNGISQNYIDAIESRKRANQDLVAHFVSELSPEERKRTGEFYKQLSATLDRDISRARDVQSVAMLNDNARRAKFVAMEDSLSIIAPSGEIYVANADGSGMEKVSVRDFAYRIQDADVKADSQVWIQGRTTDWQTIGTTPLRDMVWDSLGLAKPVQGMPPPLPQEPALYVPPSAQQEMVSAMRVLSDALDSNQDVGVLAVLLEDALQKTQLHSQDIQASPSQETQKSLSQFGDSIRTMALMDGDMATMVQVDALMSKAARQWTPESTPAMQRS